MDRIKASMIKIGSGANDTLDLSNYTSPNATSGSYTNIGTSDTLVSAIVKLEGAVKGILSGDLSVGLTRNIPTQAGLGNIYITDDDAEEEEQEP